MTGPACAGSEPTSWPSFPVFSRSCATCFPWLEAKTPTVFADHLIGDFHSSDTCWAMQFILEMRGKIPLSTLGTLVSEEIGTLVVITEKVCLKGSAKGKSSFLGWNLHRNTVLFWGRGPSHSDTPMCSSRAIQEYESG